MRYVIVGGGIAGVNACEVIRKKDPKGEIVLIDAEEHPLYSRVLLGAYLVGKISREKIFLKTESWYDEQKIEWLRGLQAKALDPINHAVTLSDGREIPYDKLLLAGGCQPRLLGEDLRGVSYLRTLDDADHLHQLLREQRDHCCGFIYGGGFIACEYLWIFSHHHISTTIAFRGPWFWSKVLDAQSGGMIEKWLQKKGVRVIPSVSIQKLLGQETLEGVETEGQIWESTLLGVGIGTAPELYWIKEAGVDTQEGVCVDKNMQTSIPDMYAAGDIVEVKDEISGRSLVARTWTNAMLQGRIAGANMTGGHEMYETVPSYSMSILGLDAIFIGDTSREAAEEIITNGTEGTGIIQRFLRDGRIVGATLVGRSQERSALTKAIQEKKEAFL
ncbi:TPA: hypothetical protein DEP34_04355 [Candidatus Uhrbacteria bacterium]|uniref:FAD-dependent pyridine nucleotide-disulfide oxidoreductase n=1 Tax=Candidatus Uhrbacteria bacterium GW2011_GWE2_46_68 TaxID=1618994 RepID=A0A0G1SHD7_9BACT|nr:MAG: FAD-dependent pyridine nucleotide-disulfide oxidoreductase [Candidatus Uhrbacteria bacterium GW2011_GWE2_46_68]HBK33508.1 hypothetical protein [Candidatus Uhrbacteria bacterium]HCB19581.1 hypothetical protein [Candidatus Uhrbacteria bacterium]